MDITIGNIDDIIRKAKRDLRTASKNPSHYCFKWGESEWKTLKAFADRNGIKLDNSTRLLGMRQFLDPKVESYEIHPDI